MPLYTSHYFIREQSTELFEVHQLSPLADSDNDSDLPDLPPVHWARQIQDNEQPGNIIVVVIIIIDAHNCTPVDFVFL